MEYLNVDAVAAVQTVPRDLAWGKARVAMESDGWKLSVSFTLQPAKTHIINEFARCVQEVETVVRNTSELLNKGSSGSFGVVRDMLSSTFSIRVNKPNKHLSPLSSNAVQVFCAEVFSKLIFVWCAQVERMTVKCMENVVERFQTLGYSFEILMFENLVKELSSICVSTARFLYDGVFSSHEVCDVLEKHTSFLEKTRLNMKYLPPASVKRSPSSSSLFARGSNEQNNKRVKFSVEKTCLF